MMLNLDTWACPPWDIRIDCVLTAHLLFKMTIGHYSDHCCDFQGSVLFLYMVWQQKHWYCRLWWLLLPSPSFGFTSGLGVRAPHTCLSSGYFVKQGKLGSALVFWGQPFQLALADHVKHLRNACVCSVFRTRLIFLFLKHKMEFA